MSADLGQRASSDELSPVIRALRITADEVQFGRVLAAICRDSEVADAFVSAVVELAVGGHADARQAVSGRRADVRCIDEQRLEARVSRRALRRRAKDLGRVDLEFSGSNGWQLLVELKLDADFGDRQIERYTEESPVAAVVRDPSQHSPRLSDSQWVGAVSWSDLLPRPRSLPVDQRWRKEWLHLLEVMKADADFSLRRPDGVPEVLAARELLTSAAPQILASFCEHLTATYGADAAVATRRLRHSKPSGKRGPWAGFNINTPHDSPWLYLEVRNVWSRAPRIRIWHWHGPERRVKKEVRAAYEELPDRTGFRLLNDGAMVDRTHPTRETDGSDLPKEITRRLGEMVRAGVFTPDLRQQNKHYKM